VPFEQPPQEAHVIQSLDAQRTPEKHEGQEPDNDEIEVIEVSLKSARQASREEPPEDDVLEEEPTDFGQDGDVSVDDGEYIQIRAVNTKVYISSSFCSSSRPTRD